MKSIRRFHWASLGRWAAAGALILSAPTWAQEQAYQFGQIIQQDERAEALEFLPEEEVEEAKLPWIPILSPSMICLDCWITRTVNIHHHYSQQAAERYFMHAETCADLPLGDDPRIGTGLKYTVLAPFYAGCPDLLYNGGFWGWVRSKTGHGFGLGANVGMEAPLPSPVTSGPSGPQMMTPNPPPPTSSEVSQLMPSSSGGSTPIAPAAIHRAAAPPPGAYQVASKPRWSEMTDGEILAYFGLDPTRAGVDSIALGKSLEYPVENATGWEFADQSTSTPAVDLLALSRPPAAAEAPSTEARTAEEASQESAASPPSDLSEVDALLDRVKDRPKAFSVTDQEYEKMRAIEGDLLKNF